ncbi:nicotinate phosphoribosyltransferase [Campylobacter curvus]|uniref:nicotinate phosphoribosyltransferase n=3 Tax=Campylobacter TaxID=194 RepID=UPI00027A37EE|nr:nicotinate phosphoribosyltransferase [Campylobacter curvus]EJP75146.1 hypothetical protein HMPREF1139_1303 [Campylobacter sp. FOBRC14]
MKFTKTKFRKNMNEQNILQMLNATSDEIFMAIVRGNATCQSCQDDREFISNIRENILSKEQTRIDFEQLSGVMIKIFEKYRAKNLNSILPI